MALTLRTDDEMERALTALSKTEGASRQEIIRRAVLERYERGTHHERVADATVQMMQRWSKVIDRLAKA
jgi:predicted transcriptional regulator